MKILLCDKASNLISKEYVDNKMILETPFVLLAYKVNLIKLPQSYFMNTSEGFRERLNTTLSLKQKQQLVTKVQKMAKKKNEVVNNYTRDLVNTFVNGLNSPKIYTRLELENAFKNSKLDYFVELANELLENERVEKISFLMD